MIEPISGRQFPKKVIPLIDNAKKSLDIVVFDWRWYPNDPGNPVQLFNQAIVRAVRRGVKVRAIANSDDIVSTLKSVGCHSKKLITSSLVHCKLMIIDEAIIITGSHNYTQSAFQANLELSVIITEVAQMPDFLRFFNNLWSKF